MRYYEIFGEGTADGIDSAINDQRIRLRRKIADAQSKRAEAGRDYQEKLERARDEAARAQQELTRNSLPRKTN